MYSQDAPESAGVESVWTESIRARQHATATFDEHTIEQAARAEEHAVSDVSSSTDDEARKEIQEKIEKLHSQLDALEDTPLIQDTRLIAGRGHRYSTGRKLGSELD